MVVLPEAIEEHLWFRRRREVATSKEVSPGRSWDVPEEPRQYAVFELADVMEQGRGPGPATMFLEPPPAGQGTTVERHLRVTQLPRSGDLLLSTDEEVPLLMARSSSSSNRPRYDIYLSCDSKATSLGPVFTLEGNSNRTSWVLKAVRCDQCESRGKRQCGSLELAQITQYTEMIGEGEAHCMDIAIPEVSKDGHCLASCSQCDPGFQPRRMELTSRRPQWNATHKTLTLEFNGRCSVASATNFKLDWRSEGTGPLPKGKGKLLFGKVGDTAYVLDHAFPLSTIQAFAAALSAIHWT